MAKKRQSRATKIVLASLLAASLSVPSFASAQAADVTTVNTEVKAETTKSEKADTTVNFQIFKPGTTEAQPAISSHLVTQGTMVEKNGKFEAKLTVTAKSAPMIAGIQTKQGDKYADATEVKNADGTITYSFPVVAGEVLSAKIHVVADTPKGKMDTWYDFDLKAVENKETTTTEVVEEKKEETTEVVTDKEATETTDKTEVTDADVEVYEGKVTVYKDGTKEESKMKDYIDSTVAVAKADGTYVVGMFFPKGQYVQSFKVDGQDAELDEEETGTDERLYLFEVKDIKALTTAEIHIIVNEAGVKYDSVHKVQFKFDVNFDQPVTEETTVDNPFKDIDNNENKDAILNLLAYDIIVAQDKFNPNNSLTRAQFALMIARTLELEATEVAGFQDIKGIEAENAINALAEYGIVETRDKFNPNGTLTRQQGALMIYRAIQAIEGELKVDISLPYADASTIANDEAKEAFSLLNKEGIMTGSVAKDGKTYINANKPLTRGQMAKILNNSLHFFYEFEESE
ncbi:NEAT domain-containing protein [Lysinibacillus sphaericus]|uniref:2',3'-cyclic nucleotide 2'-phosphodiesterase/3'-nucleotidase bifunctional periplasmic protein n=1 Tax=Lysinibacillus sphaericus OT4b.31 TaxID=1285586 RepID=R7ZHG5_LYSSH|nr:NEAT domain-containing protein [Lysinibacillus sphaericus]EON73518.1 2',3'-cyclic nucleotide 2'-phosphodiesterase/3'-nucleotidase bifunctional periplasmic precursor protein [Lysinibacillus sphaericus OT4b.31]